MKCITTGKCIPLSWKCDGDVDCGEPGVEDKSDESGCRKYFENKFAVKGNNLNIEKRRHLIKLSKMFDNTTAAGIIA